MKKPPNPQMAELGPFYQVCWLGLFSCALNLLVVFFFSVSLAFEMAQPMSSFIIGGAVVTFLLTWRVIHGSQKRRLEERMARGVTPMRPRLQHTLDALGDKLREFSGDTSARLVLLPESAVVLSTLRSNRGPVVEMTAGFLCTHASNPRLMEAALAHEAGHIAARDVERFLRMLSLMRTLAFFAFLYLALFCWAFVLNWEVPGLAFFLVMTAPVLLALVMALAWSALLVAREVQADAFAVKVLGERYPMEALLERQLALRAAQAGRRNALQRLRTWFIQPDLRWRSSLPFLRGRLGARVEAKLGLATAAFFSTLLYSVTLVWLWLTAQSRSVTSQAELEAMNVDRRASGTDAVFTFTEIAYRGLILGAITWAAWIAYHFYWVRSRTLGRGDSGTRSSGLRSLLYFCLPGGGLFLLERVFITPRGLTWETLLFASILPILAVLLWASGKVSLVSARERRRERPSVPLALLSFLGILMLASGLFAVATVAFMAVASERSPRLGVAMFLLSLVTVSLGAGMLAHRLAAPARASRPHAEAHP